MFIPRYAKISVDKAITSTRVAHPSGETNNCAFNNTRWISNKLQMKGRCLTIRISMKSSTLIPNVRTRTMSCGRSRITRRTSRYNLSRRSCSYWGSRDVSEAVFALSSFTKANNVCAAAKYYPPKSNSDLRNLHKAVVESAAAEHAKISVLYYILLNIDFPTRRRVFSSEFEQKAFLPPKYSIYMKGLWHLDRKEFNVRLSLSP